MYVTTTGLILRETRYKDSGKILTVLTPDEGKLTVSARGALRKNSKLAAATQVLAYADLTLVRSRDRWILNEAETIELFLGLREDIERLSLGAYFAELTEAVADGDSVSHELLPLCLNALHVLSGGKKALPLVKAAFEMRLACIAGFAPMLTRCDSCGSVDTAFLDVAGGTARCLGCAPTGGAGLSPLTAGAREAAIYITNCEMKRLFSFTLGFDAIKNLADITETYLLTQLDRRFRTLDFLKSVLT